MTDVKAGRGAERVCDWLAAHLDGKWATTVAPTGRLSAVKISARRRTRLRRYAGLLVDDETTCWGIGW